MKVDLNRLRHHTIRATIRSYPRIMPKMYAGTPADAGYGSSRFSSPNRKYRILYAASSFEAAFAEAVIRDRFVGKMRRYLYRPHLEERVITEISSNSDLDILDLTANATFLLGIASNTTRAKSHDEGQKFAEFLYDNTSLDGILYNSRINAETCIAIFNRSFSKITASTPVELLQAPGLVPFVQKLGITIRNKRSTGA